MHRQTPQQLVPGIEALPDRLTFMVNSRRGNGRWRVDAERREGLMACNCPDYRFNRNRECYHIQQVRKILACALVQETVSQWKLTA